MSPPARPALLLLLCAALAVSNAANPRQLEAVRHFLHRAHERGAPPPPPPRIVRTFTEPIDPTPPEPTPTPSPWFECPAQFGLFPNPYDCSCYFQCSYGIPFEERCQPGLEFNPISGTCDWPANIHPPCEAIPYPSTPAPPPAEEDGSSGRTFTETIDPTPPEPTPTPSPWFECPAQFGLFPDPYDCSCYFQCSYGIPFEEHCQPGLEFNPISSTCDWPANIHPPCEAIPYPSTPAPQPVDDVDEQEQLKSGDAVDAVAPQAAAAAEVPVLEKASLAVHEVDVHVPAVPALGGH